MGSMSIWHWMIIIFFAVIFLVPSCKIVQKAGYNGLLALLVLIPIVNITMFWVFAFAKWPIIRQKNLPTL